MERGDAVRFVRGRVVHTPVRGAVEILEDAFMEVDSLTGRIAAFHAQIEPGDLVHFEGTPRDALTLSDDQFLLPGFIDTHVHAPQYQYTGTGTDTPLMEWLTKYTFPVEASFADTKVAARWYGLLLDRMLAEGITTAQYFATIHVPSTELFVDLIAERGQRAFVGLVSMDQNAPSDYVSPSTEACLQDAEAFIQSTLAKQLALVQPVVTPRFIPTCSLALLHGLGELAEKYGVRIQSHAAESLDEEAFVDQLFPGTRDTQILRDTKLLNARSCMAHAVHLKDDELQAFADCGASIAHCPLSNFFFANGFLDVRRCWKQNVRVGLGTDMAGGYSPSMLRAIQTAVLTSKALEIATKGTDAMDFKDALWLATMGGAQALGLEDVTGSFAVGKSLDAIVVDPRGPQNLDFADRDTSLDVVQKLLHNGDARNFHRVFVSGRLVHERRSPA
jgi:guanine deaminase